MWGTKAAQNGVLWVWFLKGRWNEKEKRRVMVLKRPCFDMTLWECLRKGGPNQSPQRCCAGGDPPPPPFPPPPHHLSHFLRISFRLLVRECSLTSQHSSTNNQAEVDRFHFSVLFSPCACETLSKMCEVLCCPVTVFICICFSFLTFCILFWVLFQNACSRFFFFFFVVW